MLPPWARDTFPYSWGIWIHKFLQFFFGRGHFQDEWNNNPKTVRYYEKKELGLRYEIWMYLSTKCELKQWLNDRICYERIMFSPHRNLFDFLRLEESFQVLTVQSTPTGGTAKFQDIIEILDVTIVNHGIDPQRIKDIKRTINTIGKQIIEVDKLKDKAPLRV